MAWPPISIKKDLTHTRIYTAGVLTKTIKNHPDISADALDQASEIASRYGKSLPLTVFDSGQTYHLQIHPDGTTSEVENVTRNTHRRSRVALISVILASIIAVTVATIALQISPVKSEPYPTSTPEISTPLSPNPKTRLEPSEIPSTTPAPTPTPTPTAEEPDAPTTTVEQAPAATAPPAPIPPDTQPLPADPPAPAQPYSPPEPDPAITAMNTSVSSNKGSVTFSVTLTGGQAPITASVAGKTITITSTGVISGIPTGTYSWTTSCDGLTNSGSIYVP